MSDWNAEAVRHALTVARNNGFTEVELQSDGTSFQARLSPVAKASAPVSMPELAALEVPEGPAIKEITAPLVGYYKPAGTALNVGNQIKVGDPVAIIAALGLANDVESTVAGEVVRVLVQDGQSVEFGQVLAEVRPE
jgi:acetyl-CoA carboxylase biotin carboxyl carrier protein